MYTPMSNAHLINPIIKVAPKKSANSSAVTRSTSHRQINKSSLADGKVTADKKPLLKKIFRTSHDKGETATTEQQNKPSSQGTANTTRSFDDGISSLYTERRSSGSQTPTLPDNTGSSDVVFNPELEAFKERFEDERIAMFIYMLSVESPELYREVGLLTELLCKDAKSLMTVDGLGPRDIQQTLTSLLAERKNYRQSYAELERRLETERQNYRANMENIATQLEAARDHIEIARAETDRVKELYMQHSELLNDYQDGRTNDLTRAIGDLQDVTITLQNHSSAPEGFADSLECIAELTRVTIQLKATHLKLQEKHFPDETVYPPPKTSRQIEEGMEALKRASRDMPERGSAGDRQRVSRHGERFPVIPSGHAPFRSVSTNTSKFFPMDTDNSPRGMDSTEKPRAISYARDNTRPRNEFNQWLEKQRSVANSYELEDDVSMADFPSPPGMGDFTPNWMQRNNSTRR